MHNGCVVFSQVFSDLLQRNVNHIPAEKHDNLPGIGDIPAPFGGGQVGCVDIKVLRRNLDDPFRCNLLNLVGRDIVPEHFDGDVQIDFLPVKAGKGRQFCQGALQLSDVGFNIFRYVFDDFLVDEKVFQFFFFPQDGDSCLIVRRLNIGGQTPRPSWR